MTTKYKKDAEGSISLMLNINPQGSMLEQEEQIAVAVAELGRLATGLSLQSDDTSGDPVIVSNEKYTSRKQEKKVPTPLGRNRDSQARLPEIPRRPDSCSAGEPEPNSRNPLNKQF